MSQLPELIQALLEPGIYHEPTRQVELMQTQMSFVFLLDGLVYKVKKPVNLGYLDYTTLEKRLACCRKETELNRRLCPDIYLGVVPITHEKDKFALGGQSEAIEFAIKMRRLPQSGMMNVLLPKNGVSVEMVTRVAQKLANFHRLAENGLQIVAFGDLKTQITNTEENFDQTKKYVGISLSSEAYRRIADYTRNFIITKESLFKHRIDTGKIKDCHGDLHAAHVCFDKDIYIYDCIEFNDRFRYCDVASEIAFLAMDLDNYGKKDLSRSFVNAYVTASSDKELLQILDYYKCYRAYVRGKVESFKFEDPYISDEERAKALAASQKYFELAESYI